MVNMLVNTALSQVCLKGGGAITRQCVAPTGCTLLCKTSPQHFSALNSDMSSPSCGRPCWAIPTYATYATHMHGLKGLGMHANPGMTTQHAPSVSDPHAVASRAFCLEPGRW